MRTRLSCAFLSLVLIATMLALVGAAQAGPDLVVNSITPNCGGYLFANEGNEIQAVIENLGDATAGASHANFVLSDGYTEKVAVPAVGAGNTTTVAITDPTIRAASAAVTITVTADCDGEVTEDNEANNDLSIAKTVVNNGYKGKRYTGGSDITTWQTFELQGDLLYSVGDSVYLSGSSTWNTYTVNWASGDLPVPVTGTVKEARLYVIYTWDKVDGMPDYVSLSFNSVAQTRDAFYTDRKSYGSYDYPCGMLVYDVTADFSTAGNTAILTNLNPVAGNPSLRGMVLVVIYEDTTELERKILINEEFDMLNGKSSYCTTPEEATAYAPFPGSFDLGAVNSARLITVVPGGGPKEGELLFNGQTWTDVWNYAGSSQIGIDDRDVTAYLDTTNEAGFQSSADSMEASNAILIVEKIPNATVYFDPDDVRVPGYCNTTTVGVWVNPVVVMGSGKLTFNYTFCCLNVTDFVFNTTNFPAISGTITTATLTPGQVVLFFSTGIPAGLGPGPVHIGDATFHCCRDSGEYCETDLEWVPGYPDSYVEDNDIIEILPVLYTDGIFRCNIPDLVITSIVGIGNDTHYTVNYTIKNIGAASAPAGHVTCLSIDGLLTETKAVPDALAAGEEKEYAFDTVIVRNTSNPYDLIQVCADCEDAVIELDEENNCLDGRYPAEVVVSVIPELTLVQPQDQFDVKIHVDPRGQEILGVQYVLTYDTSVLRAETQTKGPFLGAIGDTIVVVNEIDQAHGIIEYAETRKGETGVKGEGNVSTIHFIAIGERGDSSPLVLSEVIVVDENKNETLVKLEDGLVNITENQPPIAIGSSKFIVNNVAKKYPSTAILCSCSYDPDWPGKGGNISYIRWAFGDGQYGTSEGLPVDNCTCKEHNYESWLWNTTSEAYEPFTVLLTVTDDGCPEESNSTEFPITVYIAGDANGDGEVNILDAVWVGKHWRDECPATDYCENCGGYLWFDPEPESHWAQKDGADLNNDCEINILDAVVIGANWRHVAWE